MQEIDLEFKRRVKLIYKLYEKRVFGFREVQDVVNLYYKKPEEVLKRYGVRD